MFEPSLLLIVQEQPDEWLVLAMEHLQADNLVVGNDLGKAQKQREDATECVIPLNQPFECRTFWGCHDRAGAPTGVRTRWRCLDAELNDSLAGYVVESPIHDKLATDEQGDRQPHVGHRISRDDETRIVYRLAARTSAEPILWKAISRRIRPRFRELANIESREQRAVDRQQLVIECAVGVVRLCWIRSRQQSFDLRGEPGCVTLSSGVDRCLPPFSQY